jgi:hypothetical protein
MAQVPQRQPNYQQPPASNVPVSMAPKPPGSGPISLPPPPTNAGVPSPAAVEKKTSLYVGKIPEGQHLRPMRLMHLLCLYPKP